MPKVYADKSVSQVRLDSVLFEKLKYIAKQEARSMNSQFEYFIKMGVQKYESENGAIVLPDPEE